MLLPKVYDVYIVPVLLLCAVMLLVFILKSIFHRPHTPQSGNPSGNPENSNKKCGKRKRRFAKKDIRASEMEEKNRHKAEKREESKAERVKLKKAEGGHQKQKQKINIRKNSTNLVENGGAQRVVKLNVPRKRN
ncbi:uncharacterized protein CELE_Y87G2A.25 [Caenorhabditis elegans]|uniref:Uncharacterized protein n=1 Tax=Caenorhabditis elegans TaxID=6239 RepID=H2KMK8_CAEEL|nr:Uncharacterized protein CELE_Y87G2A.25 [Caenorhabditis elegans]CCE71920.1 Uncharacterized protein CELE_Y87G2A.25 [Caenorhabditis elegans]|eukprot:NP_001252179.1 Uncharacterized protein CELE_Y87G2A.25 [Caenorhabditis elegans]